MTINHFEFWKDGCVATARHAINVPRVAGKEVTAGNALALIQSAPPDDAEVRDPDFRRRSFCRECLDLAFDWVVYRGTAEDQVAYDEAEFHFLVTVPGLSADTRKLLEESFAGIIQGFGLRALDMRHPANATIAHHPCDCRS